MVTTVRLSFTKAYGNARSSRTFTIAVMGGFYTLQLDALSGSKPTMSKGSRKGISHSYELITNITTSNSYYSPNRLIILSFTESIHLTGTPYGQLSLVFVFQHFQCKILINNKLLFSIMSAYLTWCTQLND